MNRGLLLSAGMPSNSAPSKLAANLLEILSEREAKVRRCPSCQSVVYSRRFSTCRECGEDLPAALRLSREDRARIAAEIASSHDRAGVFNATRRTWRLEV